MRNLPRAVCSTSGYPLWARLGASGEFIGVCNCAHAIEAGREPDLGPFPSGHRLVPLYGEQPTFDPERECLQPFYSVEGDCVVRTIMVRPLPPEWIARR
jgi:hypothetical protein